MNRLLLATGLILCALIMLSVPGATAQSSFDNGTGALSLSKGAIRDAFMELVPEGSAPPNGGTIAVGDRFVLGLWADVGLAHGDWVPGHQSYLTFTNAVLQNALVSQISTGCVLTNTVTPDLTTWDTPLMNEVCNGPNFCNFPLGGLTDPGSIAYSSGLLAQFAYGRFRVAQIGLCAIAPGRAVLHWQFSPLAPANRDTQIADLMGNRIEDPALFTDYVINVVGSTTPTITATNTPSANCIIVPGTSDSGNHCDDCVTNIILPFGVQFYGQLFTSANVSSNGNLQFASLNATGVNVCLPYQSFNYALMPYWDDLRTDCTGCGVFTSLSGSAPNRIFNIEWRTDYNRGGTANFEVRLYEGFRGSPQFIYGQISHYGESATLGMQRDTGSQFQQYGCDSGGISSGCLPSGSSSPTRTSTPTPSPTCVSSWSIVSSPNLDPNRNNLYAVDPVSANDIWAVGVGSNYHTLTEHWDGTQWNLVPSPNGLIGSMLTGVAAVSANDIWAVSYDGIFDGERTLIEHWDGTAWGIVPSPNAPRQNFLQDIVAISANDIWAVGYHNGYSAPPPETLTMHWDGSTWSVVPSPNIGSFDYLYAVDASATNDVWAVGSYSSSGVGRTLTMHWNGSAWSIVDSPNPNGNSALSDVSALSPDDVWAVGTYMAGNSPQTLIQHGDGSLWSIVPSPNTGISSRLNAVAAVSANNVWAVGYAYGQAVQTLIEHWDGNAWTIHPSPNPPGAASLDALTAVSASDVWAVGSYSDGSSSSTLTMLYSGTCSTPAVTHTPSSTGTATRTPTPFGTPDPHCIIYSYSTATATIVPGTTDTGNHCDDCTTAITLPFTFYLYYQAFTSAQVNSNGTLQFINTPLFYSNTCLPIPELTYTLFPYFDDLRTDGTSCSPSPCGIFTSVSGSVPNRIFNIEWRATYFTGLISTNFEIRLYEGTGYFEYVYGQTNGNALVGVQGTEDAFTQYSCGTPGPTSGQKISWSRIISCEPTATATRTRTASPIPTPCGMNFTDVHPDDYFYESISYLYCHGAISGYNDNTFRPYNNVTRGQICKIVVVAFAIPIDTIGGPHFTDVPEDHPFYQWIESAYNADVITGYSDGTFRPYDNLTRGQLTKIICRSIGLPPIDPQIPTFSDVPRDHPFYGYVEATYCAGIITGYSDGTFRPYNNVTRGQTCLIIYRALNGGHSCEP